MFHAVPARGCLPKSLTQDRIPSHRYTATAVNMFQTAIVAVLEIAAPMVHIEGIKRKPRTMFKTIAPPRNMAEAL
jgi:superfamily II DNA helicase RecQ